MMTGIDFVSKYLFTASDLACLGKPWGHGND